MEQDDEPIIGWNNRPRASTDGFFWLKCRRDRVTLPQYIEGRARGNMELLPDGMIRRKVFLKPSKGEGAQAEWAWADDPMELTIK